MRRCVAAVTALVLIGSASLGFAQKDDDQREDSKFYDFEQHVVDGEIQKPKGEYVDGGEEVEFDNLRNIEKKSFLEKGGSSDKVEDSEE